MVWFYTRDGEDLEVMTRYDNRTGEYVLTMYWADGRQQEERFKAGADFRKRLLALEDRLAMARWATTAPPKIFAEGWPDKRPE